jgi:class 3 adenylate cyclase/tetratricopeptide (TPR) repeat protein
MSDDAKLKCPSCRAEMLADRKFCGECGAALRIACPACGHANPAGQKFCGECGARLTAATPSATAVATPSPPSPPAIADRFASPAGYTPKHLAEKILTSKGALEGERKGVTVMFSDVSGFTAMSERLDPEDVHAIMDRAFEVILREVHHYEGTINQFLGDGVMALFGAPIAHEDHAHRALSAALAIQRELKPLADEVRRMHGVEFRMRMGINTGLVVVGAIGKDLRMDYTAVGDATNLAARLLGLAKPGQIVVSRRTQHLRDGFFVFEDLGEFQVKGKTDAVRAYGLLSEISGRTRLEVSKERGLTPLVGRERELASLTEMHHRAAGGQGAIAMIVGDPGVGKSRLLYEFVHRLDAAGIVELEATCVSYGRSMAYRPILELLRRYLGLSFGATGEEIRSHVAEALQFLGLEGEEPSVLLSHFLGVSAPPEFLNRLSGPQLKERTFGVLGDVFLRASESATLVLIVENLHWVDTASEEFLAYLAGCLPDQRLLLVLTTRPGYAASWLAPSLAETLTLEGLGAGDVRGMVQALLAAEEVSEQLFKILAEKSEGNPLYVEEILRQLRETDGIVVEDGEARLRRPDVTVPATIHDIIAARVDRLAEPLKHTLQGAAVLGRRFRVSLLARILEVAQDQTAVHLRELHGLDFVFPSAPEPEPFYSFKHALTQDVVYAGVLERRRRQHHAAAGHGLEELYAGRINDVVEILAHHYGRSAEAEKAVDYAILAGEKSQRRWANTEALAHFEAALKRLEPMEDTGANRIRRIDAVVKQSEIKFALGRHAEQVQALEAIRALVDATADPPRRAGWYYWAGFLHSITGSRPEVPIAYCREASAIADAASLDEIKPFTECCLTHVYAMAGDLRAAVEAGERALPAFERRGNVWWACRTLWGLSIALIYLGEWERSLDCCRRALEHGQAVNDGRIKVVSWWRTGWTHIQRGDPTTGVRCCQEALELAPSPVDAAMAKAAQGYGLVRLGQLQAGTAQLAEAVEWFDQSDLRLTRSSFGVWLGDSYLLQGEPGRARPILEQVMTTSREFGYRHLEGIAGRLLAQSLAGEDPGGAARHLETALRILEEVGARNEYAKALMTQAQLRRAVGDSAEARRLLGHALAVFEALGTLDEPRRVQAALAGLGVTLSE